MECLLPGEVEHALIEHRDIGHALQHRLVVDQVDVDSETALLLSLEELIRHVVLEGLHEGVQESHVNFGGIDLHRLAAELQDEEQFVPHVFVVVVVPEVQRPDEVVEALGQQHLLVFHVGG